MLTELDPADLDALRAALPALVAIADRLRVGGETTADRGEAIG